MTENVLFTPIKVGRKELRNRFVMTGHATGMAEDHMPAEQMRAYYRERARGGVAMIVSEASSVHRSAAHMNQTIFLFDPRIVDRYQLLTRELHDLGCLFTAQLWHSGNNTDSTKTEHAVWAPSAIAGVLNYEIAHEVTTSEIAELVDAYATAAEHARKGGADGVEIHMAHGYLPQQFMSPFTNKRRDEYGGSLENRMRFPMEVLSAVREAVGDGMMVGIRISGEEGVPDGLDLPQNREMARLLAETGAVSYFSVSFGNYHNMEIQTAPMGTPPAHLSHLAGAIRKVAAGVPVLAVGRILSPGLAAQVVESGQADLIGMARELITDPQYVEKAASDPDLIRQCIGCNFCQSRLWFGKHVSCVYNPASGREQELGVETITSVKTPRRVVVVGGGPAGMEAARVAALRGHNVSLYEREAELGGQLRFAARPESRREVENITAFLTRELQRLEVQVNTGAEVTEETLGGLAPDAVIVATGSRPRTLGANGARSDLPAIPGIETAAAFTSWDILGEGADAGPRVLVVDYEGHVQAMAVADFLLDQGKQVEIVTQMPYVGMNIGGTTWVKLTQNLSAKGAVLTGNSLVSLVEGTTVTIEQIYGGGETRREADAIVIVGDAVADEMARTLANSPKRYEVISVGDCVAPRHIDMAIMEGHRAGRAV